MRRTIEENITAQERLLTMLTDSVSAASREDVRAHELLADINKDFLDARLIYLSSVKYINDYYRDIAFRGGYL